MHWSRYSIKIMRPFKMITFMVFGHKLYSIKVTKEWNGMFHRSTNNIIMWRVNTIKALRNWAISFIIHLISLIESIKFEIFLWIMERFTEIMDVIKTKDDKTIIQIWNMLNWISMRWWFYKYYHSDFGYVCSYFSKFISLIFIIISNSTLN